MLGPVKEALKVAEQSAYEYFSHFSEGLRKDVHEVGDDRMEGLTQGQSS